MASVSLLSDSDLIARLPMLVQAERGAMADVIEHLVEIERRRLYLEQATSSLYRYCIERLGYPEDAALKRHRVARLALRLPQVLEELRAGTIHLTGLFLLSTHLTEDNARALLAEARGKSRRQIEELIARWFPRPDAPPSLEPLVAPAADPARAEQPSLPAAAPSRATCPGAGRSETSGRLEPLSPSRYRVEFTARAELRDKVERARELLSHVLPSGDLGELFERALDALIEKETRRRLGAGRPRKRRKLHEGLRHVPLEIARAVWERDGGQCTYVDAEGRRCSERRFVTLEHRQPFALGGSATLDNVCLLCACHNAGSARAVFGERHIEDKIKARTQPMNGVHDHREHDHREYDHREYDHREQSVGAETGATATPPEVPAKVLSALCQLGFRRRNATAAIERVRASEPGLQVEQFLRKSLLLLVPAAN
jgi:hypothetical protein